MKRITILAAAMILAGVAAVKLYLPDSADKALDAAADTLFPGDRAVISLLSEDLDEPVSAGAKIVTVEYCPAPEIPEAVGVFLQSQREYADLALPSSATYDYLTPPEGYIAPVSGYLSSGYGYRVHPITQEVSFHYGTDVPAWTGDSVRCFLDGTVTEAASNDIYGNYIVVSHEDGWESLYAHCSELMAQPGQTVSAGECIARVGATGYVTGPHLHFELMHNGVNVNPEYYINSL